MFEGSYGVSKGPSEGYKEMQQRRFVRVRAWRSLVSLQESSVLKVEAKCWSGSQHLYVFCIMGL